MPDGGKDVGRTAWAVAFASKVKGLEIIIIPPMAVTLCLR
jgi:hypothetical protein